jgi:hypothetical protein
MSATLTAGKLRFVRHVTRFPDPMWYFGLDLGQRFDHSALAALHLRWTPQGRCPVTFEYQFEPHLEIRFLKRFPIGITYEKLYELLKEAFQHFDPTLPWRAKHLIIDAGGPGPPLVDRLRRHLSESVRIKPVIITGGKGANSLSGGYTGVPRRTIVSNLQLLMGARTIKCDPKLDSWPILKAELLELSGATTHPEDYKSHDDVAMATGLAAWSATTDFPELLPEVEGEFRRNQDDQGPLL